MGCPTLSCDSPLYFCLQESALFNNVDVLIGPLHVELLTSILLKILVVVQLLKQGAILLDTTAVKYILLLKTGRATIHTYDGD